MEQLHKAVDGIPVPEGLEQRLLDGCRRAAAPKTAVPLRRRLVYLLPAAAALAAAILITVTAVGIPGSGVPVTSPDRPDVSDNVGVSDGNQMLGPGTAGLLPAGSTTLSPSTTTGTTTTTTVNRQEADTDGMGPTYSDNNAVFTTIPAALKGRTVLLADWGEANAAEYRKVVARFTADTDIKVKMLVYSSTDYITKVSQQIAAGSSPDIAACNSTFPQALEVVQPLPKIFDIRDGFWDPRVSEATSVGSKYYFVNSYNSPFTGGYVVYFNKKIYHNNGLTSPSDYYKRGEWSYENLYKCMQDAVRLGYKGGRIEAMTLAEQMGVSLINYDQWTGTFSGKTGDPALVKAMQFMSRAVDEGLAGGSIGGFNNGQVGICMLGTYGLKYDGYFKDLPPSDIGVVPLPTSFEGKKLTYMPLGYRGYGICKGAKNAQAAYYFLRYFLDLDKYEAADARIFANKVLERYFRYTQLPLFQKSPLYFEYFQGALQLAEKPWDGADWTAVRHAPTGQIAVELMNMQNVCDLAAALATQHLREHTQ